MTSYKVHNDGDGCWPDLPERNVTDFRDGHVEIAPLTGGMQSGRTSVTIRVDTSERDTVMLQFPLDSLMTVLSVIKASHG